MKKNAPQQVTKKGGNWRAEDWLDKGISLAQINEIKEVFDFFDTDLGGSMDIKCTSYLIQNSKPQLLPQVSNLITAKPDAANSKKKIHKRFNLFDSDRTSYISLQNLLRVAKEIAENADTKQLTEMINRVDQDGDMAVTEEQFYHIVIHGKFFKNR